ncbi:hypothetical protein NE237_009597 [Protea cynaroides]|uniref:Uncharacterized protein n=1 Tax=Protea cynaroides TaxID=273540 RepID=A0A9Q0KXR3_9MAGN|nr:hypothetical protein NE237_009597 [Protea cynaroides]
MIVRQWKRRSAAFADSKMTNHFEGKEIFRFYFYFWVLHVHGVRPGVAEIWTRVASSCLGPWTLRKEEPRNGKSHLYNCESVREVQNRPGSYRIFDSKSLLRSQQGKPILSKGKGLHFNEKNNAEITLREVEVGGEDSEELEEKIEETKLDKGKKEDKEKKKEKEEDKGEKKRKHGKDKSSDVEKLKKKLDKINTKIQALLEKKADIMRLISEAEAEKCAIAEKPKDTVAGVVA